MNRGLKCQTKAIKLLGENTEENLQELGLGKEFLDRTFKAKPTKEKMIYWTSLKLKPCALQDSLKKMKRLNNRLNNSICKTTYLTKDWYPGHIQNSQNPTEKKSNLKMSKRHGETVHQ